MAGSNGKQGQGTRLVTTGRTGDFARHVVNPPVWRASTHLYPDCASLREGPKANEDGRFFYGRRGAPTQWALADALTQLQTQRGLLAQCIARLEAQRAQKQQRSPWGTAWPWLSLAMILIALALGAS